MFLFCAVSEIFNVE